jgi:hypothetical protein
MTLLEQLSQWYRAQCDEDWEHSYGVVIETMDNPGWWVKIDLRDTILEHVPFETFRSGDCEADDASWVVCEKKDTQFHGMGDPAQLEVIIKCFLDWAQRRDNWLAVPGEVELKARDDNELWELLGRAEGKNVAGWKAATNSEFGTRFIVGRTIGCMCLIVGCPWGGKIDAVRTAV